MSFYGLYLYNEGQVRIWPYERANGTHTVDVLERLRREFPQRRVVVLWDGAGYHRSGIVKEAARRLEIQLEPLSGYSPDLMPVEALWKWLREEVTYNYCHADCDELRARVTAFAARINRNPHEVADRLWTPDHLEPEEEKLRIPR